MNIWFSTEALLPRRYWKYCIKLDRKRFNFFAEQWWRGSVLQWFMLANFLLAIQNFRRRRTFRIYISYFWNWPFHTNLELPILISVVYTLPYFYYFPHLPACVMRARAEFFARFIVRYLRNSSKMIFMERLQTKTDTKTFHNWHVM